MPLLKNVLSLLTDLAYPSTCAHCETFCDNSGPLCPDCDQKLLALAAAPGCIHCATPLAQANAPCPRCLGKGLYPYEKVLRLAVFHEPLKTLIHHIKYNRRWPLADYLADQLLAQPRIQNLLTQIDAILPVPLHRRQQLKRGYNQATLIALRIARKSRLPIIHPVVRIRDTPSQTNLPQKARHANVRGAFALRKPHQITTKRILIVDDVMTTGATLQSVARTLLPAKPAQLSALILAVADRLHRQFEIV